MGSDDPKNRRSYAAPPGVVLGGIFVLGLGMGVVLTLLGGLAVLMTPELVSNGLVPAGLAWASMYIIMAIMEELSDNPKATVEKAARSPTKKPPSTTKGRSKSPAKLNSPRRTKLKGFKDT